jgi:SAM-dependent methyltransferase
VNELFFELFEGLPRQGPGETASTLRALGLSPPLTADARVVDLGCGTGAQTLVLAQHTPAHILALDTHAPFVQELRWKAELLGLGGRVEARVGDMAKLDVPDGAYDLVWSEGAIYVIGFDIGLKAWRRLLKPGGHLAVTEACWLTADRPAECAAFWASEYPAIRNVAANLAAIERCGYEPRGHFALPGSSWWDEYYTPLEKKVRAFRDRHSEEPEALELAAQVEREIHMHRAYGDRYGYVFFVMRRPVA